MVSMINVEVQRHGNENVGGLMRRFSRKMQSSGVVRRVRGLRYFKRNISDTKQKKEALTRIKSTEKFLELFKEGRKIAPSKKRR
jgi:ribosomal protein S21